MDLHESQASESLTSRCASQGVLEDPQLRDISLTFCNCDGQHTQWLEQLMDDWEEALVACLKTGLDGVWHDGSFSNSPPCSRPSVELCRETLTIWQIRFPQGGQILHSLRQHQTGLN